MKLLKNKFFIICLAVAVFLTAFTITLSSLGFSSQIRGVVNLALTPFSWIADKCVGAVEGTFEYLKSVENYADENDKLTQEIESLKGALSNAEAALDENDRLREYLEIKEAHEDFSFVEALVVSTESSNNFSVFSINRGTRDGIEIGMPVITPAGIVGYVCETSTFSSKVRSITEATAGVGVFSSRSGDLGIVSGDISFKNTGKCKLSYISPSADVKVGDAIYTSGTGPIYPRNLLLGHVEEVTVNKFTREITATISCSADFKNLKYLLVVTDFDVYIETESENAEE